MKHHCITSCDTNSCCRRCQCEYFNTETTTVSGSNCSSPLSGGLIPNLPSCCLYISLNYQFSARISTRLHSDKLLLSLQMLLIKSVSEQPHICLQTQYLVGNKCCPMCLPGKIYQRVKETFHISQVTPIFVTLVLITFFIMKYLILNRTSGKNWLCRVQTYILSALLRRDLHEPAQWTQKVFPLHRLW